MSELWARFAAVAADNPNAWSRRRTPPRRSARSRPTTAWCASRTRSACAPTSTSTRPRRCCSARTKRRAPPAFPTTAWCSCTRRPRRTTTTSSPSAGRSPTRPAIATAVGDALDAAGITLDDVARFDLYSCFPSAVQVGDARARHRRRRSAAAHRHRRPRASRAGRSTTTRRTRSRAWSRCCAPIPSSFGCTTALGWYISKHASGVWSATPPADGFRRVDARRARPRSTRCRAAEPAGLVDGDVTLEATSVAFERDGTPSLGIVTALTADGRRALANTRDADALQALTDRGARGPSRARSPTTAARTRPGCDAGYGATMQPSRVRMMWRGATRRCARCGSGHLFRRWFTMVRRLPALRPALRARSRLLDRRARDQHDPRGRRLHDRVRDRAGAHGPRRAGRTAARDSSCRSC